MIALLLWFASFECMSPQRLWPPTTFLFAGMRQQARVKIFVFNYVVLVVLFGLLKARSGFPAFLGAMSTAQRWLLFVDFLSVMLFKTETDQQSLPVLFMLGNTLRTLFRRNLSLDVVPNPEPYVQNSFDLLKTLREYKGTPTGTAMGTALETLTLFVESHAVAVLTREAVVARREAESRLWQAVRVCGTARYPEGEIQRIPRISGFHQLSIYVGNFLVFFGVFAIISLLTGNWSVLTTDGLWFFGTHVVLCWQVPSRYYKELFDQSSVPAPAVLAFMPGYGWLRYVYWVALSALGILLPIAARYAMD